MKQKDTESLSAAPGQLHSGRSTRKRVGLGLSAVALMLVLTPVVADAQPVFSKMFVPDTIGPGSVSTLTFTIDNLDWESAVDALAFTDTLPAGVTIASPAAVTSSCGGTVTASSGGGTITVSDGEIGAFSSCSITVNVTSSTPGTHMNVSGDLTSSAGNSGAASDDLVVTTNRPGFIKSFSPASVALGSRSTLTFLVDNTANASPVAQLELTDNLPPGMVIADPAAAATTCGHPLIPATLTAAPGTSVITLFAFGDVSFPVLTAFESCTVTVDVIATAGGMLGNVSEELFATVGTTRGSSGKASAILTSTVAALGLRKSFLDDPVAPGGTVRLQFRIDNRSRDSAATGISFTDDLSATLNGLAAAGLPRNGVCGPGSQLSGTSVIALIGGTLPSGGSCTFSVTLQVPANASSGAYANTTSLPVATIGGDVAVGNAASDTLFVSKAPILTKEFIDDPVAAGDTVTLRFKITDTTTAGGATSIEFEDVLTTFLPFPVAASLPTTPCNSGSSMNLVSCGTDCQALSLTEGSLPAAGMCEFTVTLTIPAAMPPGTFTNTTSPITAMVGGAPVGGKPATDTIVVVAAPTLMKSFTDDPVVPADTATLQFILSHSANAPANATGIAFTDPLNTALAGLVAVTPLPINGVCGAGSRLGGTASNLSFSGGTLAPGASCSFSVTLQVPAAAPAGNHKNATSAVTATVLGKAVTRSAAVDFLEVAGLVLRKSFSDDPTVPGGSVNLQFTLANQSPVSSASSIAFTDDLDAALSGLQATFLPSPVCNGATFNGPSLLTFSGGSLAAGASCQFSAALAVPGNADPGQYRNSTSQVTADFGGTAVTVSGASDDLVVLEPLSIAKSFIDDPVAPGDSVTLEFTLSNAAEAQNATGLAFTDDLEAVLPGLIASDLPAAESACNGGTISGKSELSFSGGSLEPGASCSFRVTLDVPAAVVSGTVFTNTTSPITGMVGDYSTSGDPASDDLRVAVCLAPDGESFTLQDDTLLGAQAVEVCDTIFVGPNFSVAGPSGVLTLRSGNRIVFRNGASVGVGGRLSAGQAPGL